MIQLRLLRALLLTLTATLAAGCGASSKEAAANRPPEVGVIVVQPQRASISTLLPGRTVAYRIAQVRPQVSGIIKKRLYTEGAVVAAGQPLYQLDPAPYQAAADSARAALAKADANALTTHQKYDRYQQLALSGDVSQQDRDDVTANMRQAEADQATARAAVETAQINLGYTRIVAPIEGRTGTSAYTEGALVTANQDNALTTVQQYDPMYVDLAQAAADVLRLRQQFAAGKLKRSDERRASVQLRLEDGSLYGREGRLEFTGVTVSESTGAITLRAVFPNPDGTLLPGMFVRAQLDQATDESALLLPQQAVSRDTRGGAIALVVGAQDRVEQRSLSVEAAGGNLWRVSSGLSRGDRVIVQGQQKAHVGAAVKPVVINLPTAAQG
jgi:membrane fusion protein (multidrug efflux system)